MDRLLQGKIAVITGGGQGIGEGIALVFAKHGADVVILDVDPDRSIAVARKVRELGVRSMSLVLDVTATAEISLAVEKITHEFGPIDIWVNNAGISRNVSLEELTEEEWNLLLDINLKAVVFCCKAVYGKMVERKSGKIINIASLAGQRGGRFAGVHYSAAKAGVIVVTKSLALSAATHNINVNAIAPGLIRTRISEALGFGNMTSDIPLGRLGTPEDVGKVALFLASSLSDYVTGQTISVNGGMYMG